jgi:hypothetical protein
MPGLRELQLQFVAALFGSGESPVHGYVREEGIDADARIDIYRNNLREGFRRALAIGFPVIERLVGEAFFRQLAAGFLRVHPSRRGNLHHIGKPFPAWLETRFKDTGYAYLPDVAKLEWAYQEALVARDAPALRVEALRDIDPALYEQLTFQFHPACAFVRSAFPIVRIWQANQPESSSDEVIDLSSGGDNVLVTRTPEGVELHRLPDEQYVFLQSLACGEPLGTALDHALNVRPDFDAQAGLRHLFDLHLVTATGPASPST